MKVKIEGRYTCGHRYEREVELPEPDPHPPITNTEWWDEWFWEEVFPHTGDGVFGAYGGWTEAVIVDAEDLALVEGRYEWLD